MRRMRRWMTRCALWACAVLAVMVALCAGPALAAGPYYVKQIDGMVYYKEGGWPDETDANKPLLKNVTDTLRDSLHYKGDVYVAAGTYRSNDPSHTMYLVEGLKLYGGFAGTETGLADRELDARGHPVHATILTGKELTNQPILIADNVTAATVLDGFTITGGTITQNIGHGGGAGMRCDSASPTIANCIFSDNHNKLPRDNDSGGGMYNINGSAPVMTNCIFSGNSATGHGGGMFNQNSAPILRDCIFVGNKAHGGGGIFNAVTDSSPTYAPQLTDCVFIENEALGSENAGSGGGIYNSGKGENALKPTLTGCVFIKNKASTTDGRGGGMYDNASSPTVERCVFVENSASAGAGMHTSLKGQVTNCTFAKNEGAGMYSNGTLALTNCTFTGNSTGITLAASANVTAINTIFWDNSDNEISSQPTTTLTLTNCVVKDGDGSKVITDDPKLGTVERTITIRDETYSYTACYAPGEGSSAISKGTSEGAPPDDQRGWKRVGTPDIGAYESDGTLEEGGLTVTLSDPSPTSAAPGGTVTFTVSAKAGKGLFAEDVTTGLVVECSPGTARLSGDKLVLTVPAGTASGALEVSFTFSYAGATATETASVTVTGGGSGGGGGSEGGGRPGGGGSSGGNTTPATGNPGATLKAVSVPTVDGMAEVPLSGTAAFRLGTWFGEDRKPVTPTKLTVIVDGEAQTVIVTGGRFVLPAVSDGEHALHVEATLSDGSTLESDALYVVLGRGTLTAPDLKASPESAEAGETVTFDLGGWINKRESVEASDVRWLLDGMDVTALVEDGKLTVEAVDGGDGKMTLIVTGRLPNGLEGRATVDVAVTAAPMPEPEPTPTPRGSGGGCDASGLGGPALACALWCMGLGALARRRKA